jgi:small subunit ribosomal protein S14
MKKFFYKSSQLLKDKRKRISFQKNEILCCSLGLLFESNFSKIRLKEKVSVLSLRTISTFKNRCLITGRGDSIFQRLRLSRIAFREKASAGLLPGIKRSV